MPCDSVLFRDLTMISGQEKSVWTVDQAVALSLAKDPTVVSWDVISTAFPDVVWTPCQITDFAKFSRFTNHFRLRRELLFDNIVFGNVGFVEAQFGWVTPIKFVNWIRQHDLWAPAELAEYVQKYHVELIDWEAEAFRLRHEKELLRIRIEKIQRSFRETPSRTRITLQKMILAMAKSKY